MPNGAADLAVEAARGAVRIQTGRVANYAFAMIIGLVFFVSLFMLGLPLMNAAGFPLLSLLTFLPLAGAAIILFVRGDEAVVARNARWTALWTSLIVFVLSLILWVALRPQHGRVPVRRAAWPGCRSSASATTWAWTASRCCSCCSPRR